MPAGACLPTSAYAPHTPSLNTAAPVRPLPPGAAVCAASTHAGLAMLGPCSCHKLGNTAACAISEAAGLAVPISDCTTYGNCTLAMYMGFSGADRHGTTLNTASQIHQINQYSATTLYYKLTSSVRTCQAAWALTCSPLSSLPQQHRSSPCSTVQQHSPPPQNLDGLSRAKDC